MTRRPRATRNVRATAPAVPSPPASHTAARMMVELEIHREELATQNDDLRRANASLVAVKERYAMLYDQAPVAYFTLGADGALVEVNVAGAALVGIPRRFLFGRSFDALVAASSRAAFRRFREGIRDGGVVAAHESVLVTGRGLVPVRIDAAPVDGETGGECILCVMDESERRDREARQRQTQGTHAESSRLASLGWLAAGAAQDFDGILSAIRVGAELLLLESELPASAVEHARVIRDATTRAAMLSQEMLACVGKSPARFAPVDLSELVRSNRAALERLAPARSVRFELAKRLPAIEADAERIQQILAHLVTNAAEATQTGGTIIVRTRADKASVVLEVLDDGHGMDAGTQRHAFDPFFTTKVAGRGVGLAVVHGHALSHGASVTIDSRPHEGATLRITFPARIRAAPRA